MRALAILIVILATSRAAHAQMPKSFGSWMHYEVSELHAVDESMTSSTDLVLAGARVGGFIGGKRVAYAASFDFAFGSTIGKSGFMYELGLLPIGIAFRPSERSVIAFATGIAGSGAIGTLDDAVILPLELTAEATLGPLRFLARGRASFLGASDARQNGSPTVTWADELDAMLAIRVGSNYDKFRLASGNGYFLGATYREMEGAKFIGVVIGHSVDMGSQMRERRYDYDGCPDCE
jgi:hypothetical protein